MDIGPGSGAKVTTLPHELVETELGGTVDPLSIVTIKTEPDEVTIKEELDEECGSSAYEAEVKIEPDTGATESPDLAEATAVKLEEDPLVLNNGDATPVYECKLCGEVFASGKDLNLHEIFDNHKKPTYCELCSKWFKKSFIKGHKCVEERDDLFVCRICRRTFTEELELKKHEDYHKGPFTCTVCDKTFLSRRGFELHRFAHTGELPFECEQCKMRFKHPSVLAKHVRKHRKVTRIEEVPYECEHCSETFHYFTAYRRHVQIHPCASITDSPNEISLGSINDFLFFDRK